MAMCQPLLQLVRAYPVRTWNAPRQHRRSCASTARPVHASAPCYPSAWTPRAALGGRKAKLENFGILQGMLTQLWMEGVLSTMSVKSGARQDESARPTQHSAKKLRIGDRTRLQRAPQRK
eukprot:3186723-Pleurochrysis_carterae.AAC.2